MWWLFMFKSPERRDIFFFPINKMVSDMEFAYFVKGGNFYFVKGGKVI